MKEFTLKDVLEFSRNIEKESYDHYKNLGHEFSDTTLKSLAEDLGAEELNHYNRINRLLEETRLNSRELDTIVSVRQSDYDSLIANRAIPKNPTALTILQEAYEREVNTESVYRSLISITDLHDEIIQVFTDLMNQEKGHAKRIKGMMDQY